jgi:hypothetical protein
MLKSFVRLECANQSEISQQIFDYVVNRTTVLTAGDLGWNFLDTKDLLTHVLLLQKFFHDLKLLPRHSAVTVIRNTDQLPIHIDEEPVIAKINWPVANVNGWANRWYHIDDEDLRECPRRENQFGSSVYDLSQLQPHQITLCDELLDMPSPIVFNSSRAHSVEMIEPTSFPRIVASFTFFNQPMDMLK